MSSTTLESVVGRGAATLSLSLEELRAIVIEALAEIGPGERVLAIVPDKTRDDNTDHLVPFAGVGVNESAAYDMLCFHLQFVPKPLVVLWEHEPNAYESNMVHFVARDFAELMGLVFARTS